jgi:hypothetical protein
VKKHPLFYTQDVGGSNPSPPILFLTIAANRARNERLFRPPAALPVSPRRAKCGKQGLFLLLRLSPPSALSAKERERLVQEWVLDGEIRQPSKRALEERRSVADQFFGFLRDRGPEAVGTTKRRLFLHPRDDV